MIRDPTPIPGHVHPSATAYRAGCGCRKCVMATKTQRVRREMYGPGLVDANPVRDQVAQFVEEGFSYNQIASVARVTPSVVKDMLDPKLGRQRINRPAAVSLLALTRSQLLTKAAPTSTVPSVGAIRRMQALQRTGWALRMLAKDRLEYYVLNKIAYEKRPGIEARYHHRIANIYAERWDTPGGNRLTQARAVRLGYAPPMAWTDIDDPSSVPDLGSADYDPFTAFVEDAAHLWGLGVEPNEILRRTGATAAAGAGRFRRLQPDHPLAGEFGRIAKRKKRAA